MDLNYFELKIDISKISNEALELWYGKTGAKFLKLIEGCKFQYNKKWHGDILYCKNNLYFIEYLPSDNEVFVSTPNILNVLNIVNANDLYEIISQIFNFEKDFHIDSVSDIFIPHENRITF